MLMVVEVAVTFRLKGWENVGSYVDDAGAVSGFFDVMLEMELGNTHCD